MSTRSTISGEEPLESNRRPAHYSHLCYIAATTLVCLALFSFSTDDLCVVSEDLSAVYFPRNILGMLGAKFIWGLLLTFGLAVHGTVFLLIIGSIRRFFRHDLLRRISWEYFVALFVFLLSASLLACTWGACLEGCAARYNLSGMAGGSFGDKLCGPGGILLYSINRVGITIVSGAFMLLSLGFLYYYDWAQLVSKWCTGHGDESEADAPEVPDYGVPRSSRRDEEAAGDHFELIQDTLPTAAPAEIKLAEKPRKKREEQEVVDDGASNEVKLPQRAEKKAAVASDEPPEYQLPTVDLLDIAEDGDQTAVSYQEIQSKQEQLQKVLDAFKIDSTVVSYVPGPQVTLFKIRLKDGVKVERISGIERNIKMTLCAGNVRILSPIPNEDLVGVEVPNKVRKSVMVRTMMQEKAWCVTSMALPLLLGKNISGQTIMMDLAKAPHLLIAGATGTGKSVCMNLLILSLLFKHSPDELKLIMVDPKRVEFSIYATLPHLLVPVITDCEKAAFALTWSVKEMDRRQNLLKIAGVRDIKLYNEREVDPTQVDEDGNPLPAKLPYIVIIVDELAELMQRHKAEVESPLASLAALGRALGIHCILATQRPDTHVMVGTIKSNFPVRIAFQVSSYTDSMTILGSKGAENLLGKGDMLYKTAGIGLERIQGGMASDAERDRVVEFISSQMPEQSFDLTVTQGATKDGGKGNPAGGDDDDMDDAPVSKDKSLFEQAVEVVMTSRKTSISYVQRRLGIGYNKAATLIEEMVKKGIISAKPANGNATILKTPEELGLDLSLYSREDEDDASGDESGYDSEN